MMPIIQQTLKPIAMMTAGRGELWSIRGGPLCAADLRFDPVAMRGRSDADLLLHSRGSVAVVDVFGVLDYRSSLADTRGDMLMSLLRRLGNDPGVKTIILHVDSIGGRFAGSVELAAVVREVAQRKRVVSHIDGAAGGTAYQIASQANEVIITPSGQCGWLGVMAIHHDVSEANRMDGIKPTLITAGKYKAEGHPFVPLTTEAAKHLQQQCEAAYSLQIADVARGRRVKEATVRRDFGQGRMLTPTEARRAGMVDSVLAFDLLMQREMSRANGGRNRIGSYGGNRISTVVTSSPGRPAARGTSPRWPLTADNSITVVGYAAVHGALSKKLRNEKAGITYHRRFAAGCFGRIHQQRVPIVLCVDHNAGRPVASTADGTLAVEANAHGLWFRADLPDTRRGRTFAAQIRTGIAAQASITWKGLSRFLIERFRGVEETTRVISISDLCITSSPLFPQTAVAVVDDRSPAKRERRIRLLKHSLITGK